MPVSDRDRSALVHLAQAIRPHGARRWDPPGIDAAIRKIGHLALADVALAVIRAADDRTLDTPGAIANTRSSCWRERQSDRPAPTAPSIPSSARCSVCDQPLDGHHATDGHQPTRRIRQPLTDHAAGRLEYARQAVGDAKATQHADQQPAQELTEETADD